MPIRTAVVMAIILAAGCDHQPAALPDPVDFSGTVSVAGRPLSGVGLVLRPTGPGYMANCPVQPGGRFTGKAAPGTYMYYFQPFDVGPVSEQKQSARAMTTVPAKYHEPAEDRTVQVTAGGVLDIKLDAN